MKALIKINYPSLEEAKAIAMALAPDNLKVPQTLKIDTVYEDRFLIIQVECRGSIETFISTIDEILGLVSMVENIFKGLEGLV